MINCYDPCCQRYFPVYSFSVARKVLAATCRNDVLITREDETQDKTVTPVPSSDKVPDEALIKLIEAFTKCFPPGREGQKDFDSALQGMQLWSLMEQIALFYPSNENSSVQSAESGENKGEEGDFVSDQGRRFKEMMKQFPALDFDFFITFSGHFRDQRLQKAVLQFFELLLEQSSSTTDSPARTGLPGLADLIRQCTETGLLATSRPLQKVLLLLADVYKGQQKPELELLCYDELLDVATGKKCYRNQYHQALQNYFKTVELSLKNKMPLADPAVIPFLLVKTSDAGLSLLLGRIALQLLHYEQWPAPALRSTCFRAIETWLPQLSSIDLEQDIKGFSDIFNDIQPFSARILLLAEVLSEAYVKLGDAIQAVFLKKSGKKVLSFNGENGEEVFKKSLTCYLTASKLNAANYEANFKLFRLVSSHSNASSLFDVEIANLALFLEKADFKALTDGKSYLKNRLETYIFWLGKMETECAKKGKSPVPVSAHILAPALLRVFRHYDKLQLISCQSLAVSAFSFFLDYLDRHEAPKALLAPVFNGLSDCLPGLLRDVPDFVGSYTRSIMTLSKKRLLQPEEVSAIARFLSNALKNPEALPLPKRCVWLAFESAWLSLFSPLSVYKNQIMLGLIIIDMMLDKVRRQDVRDMVCFWQELKHLVVLSDEDALGSKRESLVSFRQDYLDILTKMLETVNGCLIPYPNDSQLLALKATLLLKRGLIYLQDGPLKDMHAALTDLEAAYPLDSANDLILSNLALALIAHGRWPEALDLFQSAVRTSAPSCGIILNYTKLALDAVKSDTQNVLDKEMLKAHMVQVFHALKSLCIFGKDNDPIGLFLDGNYFVFPQEDSHLSVPFKNGKQTAKKSVGFSPTVLSVVAHMDPLKAELGPLASMCQVMKMIMENYYNELFK